MATGADQQRKKQVLLWLEESLDATEEERSEFLASLDAKDPEAAASVRRLLLQSEGEGMLPDVLALDETKGMEPGEVVEELPQRIGSYLIKRPIGAGGMGDVYEAEQDDPKRTVALKVLKQSLLSDDAVLRFHFEAHVLGQLDHPGIARIYEAGVHVERWRLAERQIPYFAMEYIPDALSLTEHVVQRQVDLRGRIALLAKACRAVAAGHEQLVVHRDLKPSNVIVGGDGKLKVIDFGIARSVDPEDRARGIVTDPGLVAGTPLYMSPEQLSGDPSSVGVTTDVYALGVLAFEVLTGRHPLEHHSNTSIRQMTPQAAAVFVRDHRPAKLRQVRGDLSVDLEMVVAKALSLDLSLRYSHASGLAEDFERVLRNEPVHAAPPSSHYRMRKFAGRHKWTIAATALLLIGLLGLGAYLVGVRVENRFIRQGQRDRLLVERFEEVRSSETAVFGWEQRGEDILDFDAIFDGGPEPSLPRSIFEQAAIDRMRSRLAVFAEFGIPLDGSLSSRQVVDRIGEVQGRFDQAGEILWGELGGLVFVMKGWGMLGALLVDEGIEPDFAREDQLARWKRIVVEQPRGMDLMRLLRTCLNEHDDPQLGLAWSTFFNEFAFSLEWVDELEAKLEETADNVLWLGAVRTGIGGEEEAMPYFRRAAELDPTSAVAHMQLGACYANTNYDFHDPQLAIAHYTACLAIVQNWVSAWEGLGVAHLYAGNLDESERCAKRALELEPRAWNAWNNLALVHEHRGDLEEAENCYRKGLAQYPARPGMLRNLASLLGRLGRPEEGLELFSQLETVDSTRPRLFDHKGQLLLIAKRFEPALVAFERARLQDGENAELVTNIGVCRDQLGDQEGAERDYRHALQLDGQYAVAQANLAYLLDEYKRPDEAIAAYRRAFRLDPSSNQVIRNLGFLLEGEGDWCGAAGHYRNVLSKYPTDARSHLLLGLALAQMGEFEEGLAAMLVAQETQPTSVWVGFSVAVTQLHAGQVELGLLGLRKNVALVQEAVAAGAGLAQRKVDRMKTALAMAEKLGGELSVNEQAELAEIQEMAQSILVGLEEE